MQSLKTNFAHLIEIRDGFRRFTAEITTVSSAVFKTLHLLSVIKTKECSKNERITTCTITCFNP